MTPEEKLEALMAKVEAQEQELAALKRGPGSGVHHTPDTSGRRMSGLVAARSVTIATRPVVDCPEDYPNAFFGQVAEKGDVEVTNEESK